jgi:hypothetical protein
VEGETPPFFTEFPRLIRLLLRLPPVEDGVMPQLLPESLDQGKKESALAVPKKL